jgi:hypothetical protein
MARPRGECPTCKQVDKWHQHRGRWVCGFCGEPPLGDGARGTSRPPTDRGFTVAKPFRYRGPKRDYGRDPRYRRVLEAAEVARKTRKITRAERDVANAIYWHQRRHWKHREKTQRVTFAELAAEAGTSRTTVERAIPRLVEVCGLRIVMPAEGNRNGAVYRFPARSEEE